MALVGLAAFAWHRWVYLPTPRRFRAVTLSELLALTPRQFEEAVGEILRDSGFSAVTRVGRSGSGGLSADLVCRDNRGRWVMVQCKRYSPGSRVGFRDIREFVGMMASSRRPDRCLFITTSEFSGPAIALARRHGIEFVDGQGLIGMIERARGTGDDPR